jgi:hypothetical protein
MTNEQDPRRESDRCLSDLELDRFHAMQVEEGQASRIRAHLETCAQCRKRDELLIREHEQILQHLRARRIK